MSFLKKKSKISIKVTVLLLSLALNTSGLLSVSTTVASYLDVETSSGNLFEAGSIDFTLASDSLAQINFAPGATATQKVSMEDFSSLPFQYFITSDNFSGDSNFCTALDAEASINGYSKYSGKLDVLETSPSVIVDDWAFDIVFPGNEEFENKYCSFDLVYGGWQTSNIPSFGDGGFDDTEIVSSRIDSWGIRINKVYYDIKAKRKREGRREWIELYNQTNKEIDISSWSICDNESCDDLTGANPIPANGFMLINGGRRIWRRWNVPEDFIKFRLPDREIGDGLDNAADMIQLKRADGFVVDQMNWGEPDVSWVNYNSDLWSPGAVDVSEGNTLGRIPNGSDTNQAEDWYELARPTVDLIYPDQSGNLVWYWTYNYDITWNATNLNGDDEDLSVALYYIQDRDNNERISARDEKYLIVENTENDGVYNWTVPSGFLGYIWIKIVVTGPENPMLTDSATSAKIYDPFPLQLWEESPKAVVDSLLDPDNLGGEIILTEEDLAVAEDEVVEDEDVSLQEEPEEEISEEEKVIEGEVLGEAIDLEEGTEEEAEKEVIEEIFEAEPVISGGGEVIESVSEEVIEDEVVEEELTETIPQKLEEGILEETEEAAEEEVFELKIEENLKEDSEEFLEEVTEEIIEEDVIEESLAENPAEEPFLEEGEEPVEKIEKKEEDPEEVKAVVEEEGSSEDESAEETLPVIKEGEEIEEIVIEEPEIIPETLEKEVEEVVGEVVVEEIAEPDSVIEEVVGEELPVIEIQESVPEPATEELPVIDITEE